MSHLNAIAPAQCCANQFNSSNEYLKVQDGEVVATNEALRSCNEYLGTKVKQLEGIVRERDVAILASTDTSTQKQTEKLRMFSLALATTDTHERRALARELHDDLGQLLAVIGLKMTAVEKLKLPKSVKGALSECAAAIDHVPVVATDTRSGFEFVSMRDRLGLLGGTMPIQSKPGHETSVTLAAPLQPDLAGREMEELS
jgi:signal transduction histidine kinase